jgi:hypothetical protein
MSRYQSTKVTFGERSVRLRLMRPNRAVLSTKTVVFGGRTYSLHHDGSVWTTEDTYFRFAHGAASRTMHVLAGACHALGVLSKEEYAEITVLHSCAQEREHRRRLANELADYAKDIGLELTVEQQGILDAAEAGD